VLRILYCTPPSPAVLIVLAVCFFRRPSQSSPVDALPHWRRRYTLETAAQGTFRRTTRHDGPTCLLQANLASTAVSCKRCGLPFVIPPQISLPFELLLCSLSHTLVCCNIREEWSCCSFPWRSRLPLCCTTNLIHRAVRGGSCTTYLSLQLCEVQPHIGAPLRPPTDPLTVGLTSAEH
jgi:hypothetical protein